MSITGFLEIFRRDSRSNKDREIDLFLQADLKQNQIDKKIY